jgi:glycosyltransferase involved in cell wall biosynthesis
MSLPKITIVTPVYNGERFIEETIRSILDQNYPHLEYIIVDGGSTDRTLEIVKSFGDRVTRLISEKDKGMYDALTKGFSFATGELLCWLNADDKLHPMSLFSAAEIFSTFPEVEWITGTPNNFDEKGRCVEVFPQRKWSVYQYLRGDYFTIQQESVMFRKSLYDKAGGTFHPDLRYAGDFELWMRFFRQGAKLYSASILFGGFRRHGFGQLTGQISHYRNEALKVYAEMRMTDKERAVIEQLNSLERVRLKIPYLRARLGWQKKHFDLLDFPPGIHFDFHKQTFVLKG